MTAEELPAFHFILPDGSLSEELNWSDTGRVVEHLWRNLSQEGRVTFARTFAELVRHDDPAGYEKVISSI